MSTATLNAIEVHNVVHSFGATPALRDVSFAVGSNEIFGLLGPNGAGKTTMINILLTLLRPLAGTARVAGYDVVADGAAVRRAVGWVPQDRAVDPLLTARENLRFVAGIHQLAPREVRRRADELLALVGLTSHADRVVHEFSGGMRRRLELAMGLVHQPVVLFLDEPTLGLDVTARRILWDQILAIRDSGSTILLTTHYLDEADALCDRVAIIDDGRINAIGAPLELRRRYGSNSLHVELDEPNDELVKRVHSFPDVSNIRVVGCAIDIDADDLVAATTRVLAACRELQLVPRDLWARRASLEDVFVSLTGHLLSGTGNDTDGSEVI